jgi:hypothetical protein
MSKQDFDEKALWKKLFVSEEKPHDPEDDLWDFMKTEKRFAISNLHDPSLDFMLFDYLRGFLESKRMLAKKSYSREAILEKRVQALERKVQVLERLSSPPAHKPTLADKVYKKYREELEDKYLGKIVAIDSKSEEIVGIGNSVLEAYKEAIKKSEEKRFSFRRVGCKYVHRI